MNIMVGGDKNFNFNNVSILKYNKDKKFNINLFLKMFEEF